MTEIKTGAGTRKAGEVCNCKEAKDTEWGVKNMYNDQNGGYMSVKAHKIVSLGCGYFVVCKLLINQNCNPLYTKSWVPKSQ